MRDTSQLLTSLSSRMESGGSLLDGLSQASNFRDQGHAHGLVKKKMTTEKVLRGHGLVEYKFIPKPLSSQTCKFHPKPLSSQNNFIQNQFHPKDDFDERTTANKSKNKKACDAFTQTRLMPAFRVSTGLHVKHRRPSAGDASHEVRYTFIQIRKKNSSKHFRPRTFHLKQKQFHPMTLSSKKQKPN